MRIFISTSLARGIAGFTFATALGLASAALAQTSMTGPAKPMAAKPMMAKPMAAKSKTGGAPPVGWTCGAPSHNTFSDARTPIAITTPSYLNEVPAFQLDCDFHSFAWNQFIWLTQSVGTTNPVPRFLTLAPWYNLLGVKAPTAYPGGATALEAGKLDLFQAGSRDVLKDVHGYTVLYDIRFNQTMYDAIKAQGLNTLEGYKTACAANPQTGICANQIWLPPAPGLIPGQAGAMEIKTAWIAFRGACPSAEYYCDGQFGLVGIHIVQKTVTHGEWIWASFEHVANAPDCAKGGDSSIQNASQSGYPWSFFNPKTAPQSVMLTQECNVTGTAPQCNGDPKGPPGKLVNICRTDMLPTGGETACGSDASAAKAKQTPAEREAANRKLVECLDGSVMPLLSGVWKNYKLVGTVWTNNSPPPASPLPGNQDFRIQVFQSQVQGIPFQEPVGLVHLANTSMETWLQMGSTGYDPIKANAKLAGCFNCHQPPSAFAPQVFTHVADLSHFPIKLPAAALAAYKASLVKAVAPKAVAPKKK
jgi:hypothetical protein